MLANALTENMEPQAVFYQIVWQLVSVEAIVISTSHEYFNKRLQLIRKLTFCSFFLTLFLLPIKPATDAAHLLADLVSFMISLLAIYIASRRSTKR